VQGTACKSNAQSNVQGTKIDKKYLDWKELKINAAKVELDLVKQELCFKELERIMESLYSDIKHKGVYKKSLIILRNVQRNIYLYRIMRMLKKTSRNSMFM
jgi:hypothetical protein